MLLNKSKLIFFISLISGWLFAQPITNIDVCYKLINQSVASVDSVYSQMKEKPAVEISVPAALDQLRTNIITAFQDKGYNVTQSQNIPSIYFIINNSLIKYEEPFTKGLFGDAYVQRKINLTGSYFLTEKQNTSTPKSFYFEYSDTVSMDSIRDLESKNLAFTQANIPPAPVLSNLMEPIIVVGTLITTIILLFTIRSK